jgi:hypothetical protein
VGAFRLGKRMGVDWPGMRFVVESRGTGLRGPLKRESLGNEADVVDIFQLV